MLGLGNLKLIAIALAAAIAIGVPAWAAWKLGAGFAREAAQEQARKEVEAVRRDAQSKFALQERLINEANARADKVYGTLLSKLSDIKVTHTTVTKEIVKEREANPAFYEQELPPGGLQQWESSRQLLR